MICFPLDNADYQANALGAWCGTRTRGVYSADGHYAVTSNDNMTVTVSPGLAWLKADDFWGVNAFEVNSTQLTIDTAHGSLPRIDAIFVRLDKNQNLASIIIKKGEYSPQPPVAPAPVRNLDYDEICVATIYVSAGATSITASVITDTRLDESLCGLMRDGVTGIPTQTLYNQWLAWFAATQNTADSRYAIYLETIEGHEADATAAYDVYATALEVYKTSSQADFEAWVATLQGILDEQVAGHLQLEIDALNGRKPEVALGTINTEGAAFALYPLCTLLQCNWCYGMGGCGNGPAGGSELSTIPADYTFDVSNIAVKAQAIYEDYTTITKISDTRYVFTSGDSTETHSLLLQIHG